MANQTILIWLPSPMGDAVLCTPALRAIRKQFPEAAIWLYGNSVVRSVLSPNHVSDNWIEQRSSNPFAVAAEFKKYNFGMVILFKNSFMSALAVWLACIPVRIGYAREGRGFLLTKKLEPLRLPDGDYVPISMLDYYLAMAELLGAETADRLPEITVPPEDMRALREKMPEIFFTDGPKAILVVGGAFGANKCWPAEYFGKLADWLVEKYKATVILSVAPNSFEQHIAEDICKSSKHRLISLGETPLSLRELKAMFSMADLVVANDTGPRHIAIALKRKVITLFGPNDPAWTQTGYTDEIQIVADVKCAPCQEPQCHMEELICMYSISVESVCEAAEKLLAKWQGTML
ncbi:MAG: glycosyltransferase family 9 protein [Sedimentisphaerales bacterium]|nr:glycosyltransferase family 9 protein [Sedimentisphaerales bacterium]